MWSHQAVSTVLRQLDQDVEHLLSEADMSGSVAVEVIGAEGLPGFHRQADKLMPAASLYKLTAMVAFCHAVDDGEIDPIEPVSLSALARAAGPTGLAVCLDPVRMSWRDLVRMMITISDNAAGTAVLHRLGQHRVQHSIDALGMRHTAIRSAPIPHQNIGSGYPPADPEVMDPYLLPDPVEYDPLLVSATTAADVLSVLRLIWQDQAASAPQCQFMREILGQQAWGHRFAEAFTYPGVTVAAKTGSLGPLCHEAGVISHPHEPSIAVAVLTRSARREQRIPLANTTVGQIARHCVRSYRQLL